MSFERLARSRKIDYNLYIEINDDEWIFDARYLELITNNLLSNAFKYTGDGGSITIKVREQNDCLLLQVVDTGIGITQENQKKIFERFYQVHEGGNGSGIGLSLVKKLIELHHGTITLESEVGKGSVFSVYIPQNIVHTEKTSGYRMKQNKQWQKEWMYCRMGISMKRKREMRKKQILIRKIPLSRKKEYLLLKIMKISDDIWQKN